jgi:SAM-dependent methyltransferase
MDRGRCIDRWYIEGFLEHWAADIRGHVLEINDPGYAEAFGSGRTSVVDVLDIDPTNSRATIVADLRNVPGVADATFDCIILTQTIHVIYEAEAVLAECARMLKPDGVLLATVPCASKLALEQGVDRDYWRFTKVSVERLVGNAHPWSALEVRTHGNFAVTVAFLYGLACHELPDALFGDVDRTPLIISVRARKPPAKGSQS